MIGAECEPVTGPFGVVMLEMQAIQTGMVVVDEWLEENFTLVRIVAMELSSNLVETQFKHIQQAQNSMAHLLARGEQCSMTVMAFGSPIFSSWHDHKLMNKIETISG